jgi:hypothetical protein
MSKLYNEFSKEISIEVSSSWALTVSGSPPILLVKFRYKYKILNIHTITSLTSLKYKYMSYYLSLREDTSIIDIINID